MNVIEEVICAWWPDDQQTLHYMSNTFQLAFRVIHARWVWWNPVSVWFSHDCWQVHFPGMTNFNYTPVQCLLCNSKHRSKQGIPNTQRASIHRLPWKKEARWGMEATFNWTAWRHRLVQQAPAPKSAKWVVILHNILKLEWYNLPLHQLKPTTQNESYKFQQIPWLSP